jgi:hypothetical protein
LAQGAVYSHGFKKVMGVRVADNTCVFNKE